MSDWQTAMQNRVAQSSQSSVDICNEEFSDLSSDQAGYIIREASGQGYTVGNPVTKQVRFNLDASQVEPVMEEFNIANSSWS